MDFDYELNCDRETIEWKHNNSPIKKKVWTQQPVKKVMLTVFWDMIGPTTTDLFENGAKVNSASSYQL